MKTSDFKIRIMKPLRTTTALLLLTAGAACSDIIEPFYSQRYELARVEAAVVLKDETQTAEKILLESDVLQTAPVKAGGGYMIEYIEAFSGPLVVYPEEGATALQGTFDELTTEAGFVFNYGERSDTCGLTTYNNEGEAQRVLFTFDLTKKYQALFPNIGITSVVREEYTMTWAD